MTQDAFLAGVLQALSAAYFLVACAAQCVPSTGKSCSVFFRTHGLCGLLPLIALNQLVTFLLSVPGCPTGYLGPGGNSEHGRFANCTGGAHLYVDTQLFGRSHLFQNPSCQPLYQTGPYDPEGLLNWLMVAATSYLGFLAAASVYHPGGASDRAHLQRLLLLRWGSALMLASVFSGGWILFPDAWIPLNKNLWSLSYVMLSSGLACLVFALVDATVVAPICSWIVRHVESVGRNAILLYVLVSPSSTI